MKLSSAFYVSPCFPLFVCPLKIWFPLCSSILLIYFILHSVDWSHSVSVMSPTPGLMSSLRCAGSIFTQLLPLADYLMTHILWALTKGADMLHIFYLTQTLASLIISSFWYISETLSISFPAPKRSTTCTVLAVLRRKKNPPVMKKSLWKRNYCKFYVLSLLAFFFLFFFFYSCRFPVLCKH